MPVAQWLGISMRLATGWASSIEGGSALKNRPRALADARALLSVT